TSLVFAAAVSFAHDVVARRKHAPSHRGEIRAVRSAAVIVCVSGVSLAAFTFSYPTEFLVSFSMSVAASCIFPALIYSFFWPGFNRRGLLWSVYGGLLLCTALTLFSPTVSGTDFSVWPEA
ncbi:sodium:solute symporter family transporter, partial [Streptomyces sp. 4F14]|uniref:sodium:solute symporter family transporter n=1 Tax=Streptomyces sp. 4F14 TaxID=3394380 RepID=UPI003A86A592